MNRTGRASQVIDPVDFEENGIDDIVPDKLEAVVIQQVLNIPLMAGEKVVQANYFVALLNKPATEMGAQEAGPTCDQNPAWILKRG